MENERGIFFSIDALIAISIILIVILIAFPILKTTKPETQIHYDIITSLSTIKIGELDNAYVKSLIQQGIINDTNKTLIEQIGEFYVRDITLAQNLAKEALKDVKTNKNIGIWYGNKLVFSLNSSPIETAKNIETARQQISGIEEGQAVTGFSARAYLTNTLKKDYYYFGGYIGDGNITVRIEYNGTINSSEMELAINNDFKAYVNGFLAGTFTKPVNQFTPKTYILPTNNFRAGINLIELKGENLSIAGGFVKIEHKPLNLTTSKPYYFPGIDGLINIYDSFYIPTNLSSMEIYLHFNTTDPLKLFLNIGNTTLYEETGYGQSGYGQEVTLVDATIKNLLNYTLLSQKTTPIRLGLKDTNATPIQINLDTYLVTDISFSMNDSELSAAKNADKLYIDEALKISGNRVGLVAFAANVLDTNVHSLSNNVVSLKSKIDSWTGYNKTCICCGINKAIEKINADSSPNKIKNIILLSDGLPNINCHGDPGVLYDKEAISSNEWYWLDPLQNPNMQQYVTPSMYWYWDDANGTNMETWGYYWSIPQPVNHELYDDIGIPQIPNSRSNRKFDFLDYNNNNKHDPDEPHEPFYDFGFNHQRGPPYDAGERNQKWDTFEAYQNFTIRISEEDAVNASCKARQQYNITVHVVGFGGSNVVSEGYGVVYTPKTTIGEEHLEAIAACGGGDYSLANINNLNIVFNQTAQTNTNIKIVNQTAIGQPITKLYPDSYIRLVYPPITLPYGVPIIIEKQFDNAYYGQFLNPIGTTLLDAVALSYSGPYWTTRVLANNNLAYRISEYGTDYFKIGDPHSIQITNLVKSTPQPVPSGSPSPSSSPTQEEPHKVFITTGTSPGVSFSGSMSNKIIYTFIKNATTYSQISKIVKGCTWTIEFEDSTIKTIKIPAGYQTGYGESENTCSYSSALISFDQIDALQVAGFDLLKSLDTDLDSKVDVKFDDNDLQIDLNQVKGIPYTWTTEIQVRTWN